MQSLFFIVGTYLFSGITSNPGLFQYLHHLHGRYIIYYTFMSGEECWYIPRLGGGDRLINHISAIVFQIVHSKENQLRQS